MRLHQTSIVFRRFPSLLLLTVLLLASRVALADAVGNGSGFVRDASGAVIPGAKVTLTRRSTNATVTHVSDASGAFQSLELAPNTYTLSVEAPGFKRVTLSQIVVQVDQAAKLDVLLQAGDVSEVVNVDVRMSLVDTEQNTLSNVVEHTNDRLHALKFTELPRPCPADPGRDPVCQRQPGDWLQRRRGTHAVERLSDRRHQQHGHAGQRRS